MPNKNELKPRVKIQWIDSWGVNPSWESIEEALEHGSCMIWTSGYLIKQDTKTTWIAMSYDENTKMVCGVMVIPNVCILATVHDKPVRRK